MVRYPQSLKIHKKLAELQINLLKAKDVEDPSTSKVKTEAGCLFLDIAKPLGNGSDRMDWENKITMKLGHRDIAQIITGIRGPDKKVDLIHRVEKDGVPSQSTLKIEPGEGTSFKWFVAKTVGDNKKNATIYLDTVDMYSVFNLLESSVPLILGWVD
jgi:hypothetical protein